MYGTAMRPIIQPAKPKYGGTVFMPRIVKKSSSIFRNLKIIYIDGFRHIAYGKSHRQKSKSVRTF